jgi:hypothetical protein
VLTDKGSPWRPTIATIFTPFVPFRWADLPSTTFGHRKRRVDKALFFIEDAALA